MDLKFEPGPESDLDHMFPDMAPNGNTPPSP